MSAASLPPLDATASRSVIDFKAPKTRKERIDNDENRLASTNPFVLPSDEQLFKMREQERRERAEKRAKLLNLSIWEKTTSAAMLSRSVRLRELVGEQVTHKAKEEPAQSAMLQPRGEKENMSEYIAKKREMFLVQMSLDTKREEIRKLEEKAQMKEEALVRSERTLEEDAMRFDAYLKDNDKKAHEAIKKAEEETKRKQEKTHEIKRLQQQIQLLTSEMTKHREALEDCLRYKSFLDMLTPSEWITQQEEEQKLKHEQRRQAIFEELLQKWEAQKQEILEEYQVREQEELKKYERSGSMRRKGERISRLPDIPPPPSLENVQLDEQEEDLPMYFQQPQQLLEIFTTLEEQNLFLIQNSQHMEETLDELRQSFKESKDQLEDKSLALQHQLEELQAKIKEEEEKATALTVRAELTGTSVATTTPAPDVKKGKADSALTQREKELLLSMLHNKVREVYDACGFDATTKPSTVFMLAQLETKLESLLAEIEKMPQDYVIRAEKEREKRRREKKREEQQALQEMMQEERNRRSIERSLQAPNKRSGRQVMFRSRPMRKQETKDDLNEVDSNLADELKYLT